MLTLEAYLEDPCRRCSIPYWKFKRITVPDTMAIVHGDHFRPEDYPGWTDTPISVCSTGWRTFRR